MATSVRPGSVRLGFGCSVLMASLGRRESLRLLETAYDCGIRHFDVARSYGYGEAESVLGAFARGKRGEISITTKLGILPPPRYLSAAPIKQVARSLVRRLPLLRPLVRGAAGCLTSSSRFDIPTARRSLEQSLRKLGCTYVDALLLHECTVQEAVDPQLRQFLDDRVRTGSILRHGVASDRTVVLRLASGAPQIASIAQFADSIGQGPPVLGALHPGIFPVTHSVVASDLKWISERICADEQLARGWSDALNVDARIPGEIGTLLVGAALRRNPNGCVLYSSRNVECLRKTVTALASGRVSAPQCAMFDSLVMRIKASSSSALAGAA